MSIKDRRIGEFAIRGELVDEQPDAVRLVLRDVIVLMAEHQAWNDVFMYIGVHPAFEECPPNLIPPRYLPIINMTVVHGEDGQVTRVPVSVTWEMQR